MLKRAQRVAFLDRKVKNQRHEIARLIGEVERLQRALDSTRRYPLSIDAALDPSSSGVSGSTDGNVSIPAENSEVGEA